MMLQVFLATLALTAPVPDCHEELATACKTFEHKGSECTSCVTAHKSTLTGCTAAEEAAFCKVAPPAPPHPHPHPPSTACTKDLIADCGKDAKGEPCITCADAHKANLTKVGCTSTNIIDFCKAAPPAPTPEEKCAREEELLCGNDRHNKTLCTKCIALHASILKNHSCTTAETTKFCEAKPPPAPVAECEHVLEEYCDFERAQHNHTLCVACVTRHENQTRAAHCTYTQVEAFCAVKPGPPAPPVHHCYPAMEAACEAKKKVSEAECVKCITADASTLEKRDGCTVTALHEFCEPTPGPGAACVKEFTAVCGQEVRNATECIKCEDEHEALLKKANCTIAGLSALCHKAPAPHPHPPTCAAALERECEADRRNATLCSACVTNHAAVLKEAKCTAAEESAFCAHHPTPPKPTETCERVMTESCEADRHNHTKCVACLEAHHNQTIAAKCTFTEEAAFCKVAPPRPPSPPTPTEECERELVKLCEVDRHNKTKCAACEVANKAALTAAKCTAIVKERFCEAAPPAPPHPPHPTPPAPPASKCLKEQLAVCGTERTNETKCIDCMREHRNTTIAAGCTREEDETFCHMTPPTEKCREALEEECGKARNTSTAACTSCLREHLNTTKAAGCTVDQEDRFCDGHEHHRDHCGPTEFCCPDAKACLTPTGKSCAAADAACATGEICCPFTKECVTASHPCVPTATCKATEFCCPDAKHCLTPVAPGTMCDPTNKAACPAPQVCCPLIKQCVAVGAVCDPSAPPAFMVV